MPIGAIKEGNVLVVRVPGRLDAVTSGEFEAALIRMIENKERHIVLDMAALDYISSAGLRAILSAAKRIPKNEGKLCICNLSGMIQRIFEIAGFDRIFSLAASVEEALVLCRQS